MLYNPGSTLENYKNSRIYRFFPDYLVMWHSCSIVYHLNSILRVLLDPLCDTIPELPGRQNYYRDMILGNCRTIFLEIILESKSLGYSIIHKWGKTAESKATSPHK